MLDKTKVINLAELYAKEVRKILNSQAIVLFGSQVRGTANEDSDIDIAIILNGFTGDYLVYLSIEKCTIF